MSLSGSTTSDQRVSARWPCLVQDSADVIIAAEEDDQHEMATKEDFHKLARTIVKLRDERILELEAQVTRLADDARKLRTELWPLFKMVKEKEPLPYRPHDMSGLPVDYTDSAAFSSATTAEAKEPKTSLTRTFSKKLGLSSGNNKNHSPTHLPNSIPENRAAYEPLGLQPSAAANAASSSLTASMTGGNGPILPTSNAPSLPSPTSPVPYHQHLPPRSFTYSNATFDSERDTFRTGSVPPQMMSSSLHSISTNANNLPDPPKSGSTKTTFSNASTLIPPREMSASVPPQLNPSTNSRATPSSNTNAAVNSTTADTSRGEKDPTVEIFKSFRVALDDPCHKVLPAALRKYNINADWRQYALYIVYGDQERCVGLEEKPLALFKDLDREGKKPMFMLRKWAGGPPTGGSQTNPAFAGFEPSSGGGIKTAGLTNPMSSGLAEARNPRPPAGGVIPGGLL